MSDLPQTSLSVAGPEECAPLACRYCLETSTLTVEVEPGDGLRFPRLVEVCDRHAEQLTREQPDSVDSLRRRKARGVQQLSIFDMGLAPGSAIHV